ncbi:hypothetical protein BC628DRAFT_1340564 [Trametes gibbosa]|nr:hypothetical protein BC628DRAFT_1340564 [Trametes gibbosa]
MIWTCPALVPAETESETAEAAFRKATVTVLVESCARAAPDDAATLAPRRAASGVRPQRACTETVDSAPAHAQARSRRMLDLSRPPPSASTPLVPNPIPADVTHAVDSHHSQPRVRARKRVRRLFLCRAGAGALALGRGAMGISAARGGVIMLDKVPTSIADLQPMWRRADDSSGGQRRRMRVSPFSTISVGLLANGGVHVFPACARPRSRSLSLSLALSHPRARSEHSGIDNLRLPVPSPQPLGQMGDARRLSLRLGPREPPAQQLQVSCGGPLETREPRPRGMPVPAARSPPGQVSRHSHALADSSLHGIHAASLHDPALGITPAPTQQSETLLRLLNTASRGPHPSGVPPAAAEHHPNIGPHIGNGLSHSEKYRPVVAVSAHPLLLAVTLKLTGVGNPPQQPILISHRKMGDQVLLTAVLELCSTTSPRRLYRTLDQQGRNIASAAVALLTRPYEEYRAIWRVQSYCRLHAFTPPNIGLPPAVNAADDRGSPSKKKPRKRGGFRRTTLPPRRTVAQSARDTWYESSLLVRPWLPSESQKRETTMSASLNKLSSSSCRWRLSASSQYYGVRVHPLRPLNRQDLEHSYALPAAPQKLFKRCTPYRAQVDRPNGPKVLNDVPEGRTARLRRQYGQSVTVSSFLNRLSRGAAEFPAAPFGVGALAVAPLGAGTRARPENPTTPPHEVHPRCSPPLAGVHSKCRASTACFASPADQRCADCLGLLHPGRVARVIMEACDSGKRFRGTNSQAVAPTEGGPPTGTPRDVGPRTSSRLPGADTAASAAASLEPHTPELVAREV